MSDDAKDRIYDFHTILDSNNRLRMQLERHEKLRKSIEKELDLDDPLNPNDELRDPLIIDLETFKKGFIINDNRDVQTTSP